MSQLTQIASVSIHHKDLIITVAITVEDNAPAIGGQVSSNIGAVVVSQLPDIAPISLHNKNLIIAVAITREDNPPAVRQPTYCPVGAVVVSQLAHTAPISLHHKNLSIAVAITREDNHARTSANHRRLLSGSLRRLLSVLLLSGPRPLLSSCGGGVLVAGRRPTRLGRSPRAF